MNPNLVNTAVLPQNQLPFQQPLITNQNQQVQVIKRPAGLPGLPNTLRIFNAGVNNQNQPLFRQQQQQIYPNNGLWK